MISENLKTFLFTAFTLSVLAVQVPAQGATVVTVSAQGSINKIMTDGKKARIGTGKHDYMIVDYQSGSVKMVTVAKKQVVLMDQTLPSTTNVRVIHPYLKVFGAGPVIAGYQTTRYQWFANGKRCGTLDASTGALNTAGIKPLFDAVRNMVARQRAALGGYVALMDVCTQASLGLGEQINKVGIPMRVKKLNGNLLSEVKSIKTGVSLPVAIFDVPAGYKTIAMDGAVKTVKQARNGLHQQIPLPMQPMQQRQRRQPAVSRSAAAMQRQRFQYMVQQYRGH